MSCNHKTDSACPFAMTDQSEYVQGLACLPSPYEIVMMRVEHQKTWACHENPKDPCVGAIRHLKRNGLPHKVVDSDLLTEKSDWHLYVGKANETAMIVSTDH